MPSWSDLENYLRRNGWVLVRQTGRDRIFEKTMPDGTIQDRRFRNLRAKLVRGYLIAF